MPGFTSFISRALSVANSVLNAFGAQCMFTLTCGTDSLTFPVTPGSFEVSQQFNNQTLTINSLGEINLLGKKGLRTIKFGAFFPNNDYSFVSSAASSAYGYVEKITRMAESGQPCRILITGTSLSFPCTIDDFSYSEKDGTGDVYFSISLREYRYIRPDSDTIDETTGLKSRTQDVENTKNVTAYSTDNMEAAAKTVQKIQKAANAVNTGRRVVETYKALVKSGGISPGDVLTVTASVVSKNGQLLKRFGGG